MIRSAPRIGALLVTIVLFAVQGLSAQAPPPPDPVEEPPDRADPASSDESPEGRDAAAADPKACSLTPSHAAWLERVLDAWEDLTTGVLDSSPEPLPWIVTFDARCVWHVAAPPGLPEDASPVEGLPLGRDRIPVRARSHDGEILLPNGTRIPARAMAFTSLWDEAREPFFVLAMETVWHREHPASREHDLDDFFVGVAIHELVHTRQLPAVNRRFEELEADCELPEDVGVTTIEGHFADDPDFAVALARERGLFYEAAMTTEPERRRRLAAEALHSLAQRRNRFFTGSVECFGTLEDLLLALEGTAVWAHYQLARLRPDVSFLPERPTLTDRAEVLELVAEKEGGEWIRDTGFPLFLLLEEYLPEWQKHMLGAQIASPIRLLSEALEPAGVAERWAIRHVDVVPMDRPGVARDQTVVVDAGRIAAVGPSEEIEIPPGLETLDGRGRYLLPGLVDTHVHLDDPDDLLLYLANGVTTIVNLRGSPEHLAWREELARGERPGPRMLTCGPFLRGPELEVEEIANRVREISRRGYDCVKIYDDWELEAYREVAAATREAEILFLGHAPREIGLEPVIEEGSQRIVHLEEVVYATPALNRWVEAFDEEAGPPETDPGVALGEEVRRLAGRLAEAGIWVAATEVVIDTYLARSTPEGLERLAERPSWRYLDPFQRRRWARADEEDHRRFVHQVALQHLLLEAFREEGVPMALGTDASSRSDLLVMPGWSGHEELETLVEAGGFSPYQALRQATVDAHRFLGRPGGGLVVEGAAADLLVLRENPLTDVHHVSDIETVVVRGERFSRAELRARLDERRERWDPLEQALAEVEATIEREGKVAGARAYLRLVERYPDYAEEVEALVNVLGYELLFDDRIDEAIEVLRANADAFPGSANVWDSLAEAHMEKGDRDEAIRLYRRALDVDPDFSHAEEMLRELEGELGPE